MFDLNVLADMFLKRQPFALASSKAISLAGDHKVEGYVCSHAVTTLYYILRREFSHGVACIMVDETLDVMTVAVQPAQVFRLARTFETRDFEDAVTAATAVECGCPIVVTRDRRGFGLTPVEVVVPSDLWERFAGLG